MLTATATLSVTVTSTLESSPLCAGLTSTFSSSSTMRATGGGTDRVENKSTVHTREYAANNAGMITRPRRTGIWDFMMSVMRVEIRKETKTDYTQIEVSYNAQECRKHRLQSARSEQSHRGGVLVEASRSSSLVGHCHFLGHALKKKKAT